MKTSVLIVSTQSENKIFSDYAFLKAELAVARDLSAALKISQKRHFDICFIEAPLTKKSDFQMLKPVQKLDGSTELLLALEPSQIQTAMELLGVNWDYLVMPYAVNQLKLKFEKILAKRNLERENRFWRVELAALLADRGALSLSDIPAEIWEKAKEGNAKEGIQSFKRSRKEFERECLRGALERAQGSQTQAAKSLGIHRNTLIWKLKKLNLENECKKIVRKRRGY